MELKQFFLDFSGVEEDLTIGYVSWKVRRAQFIVPYVKVTFLENNLM